MTYEDFLHAHRDQLERLYAGSHGPAWAVSFETFAHGAWQGVAKAAEAEPDQIPRLLESLRHEDLALALGCVGGNERAWNAFCNRHRGTLYDAARVFIPDETRARELADSLLADLYGMDAERPGRHSRLAYFHGRSSLKTWLHAVLYQKFVDEFRRESRLEPLPEEFGEPAATERSVSADDDRRYAALLGEAVGAALADLPPPEKLLLSWYYVQGLKLHEIGRLRREHEATVSRRLESLRKKLRKRIENHLRHVQKLSAFEVDRALDFVARGVTVDLAKVLKTE